MNSYDLELELDALDSSCEGTVREIVPRADPATRTVLVKVALSPQANLVTGLFGRLLIPVGVYEALMVPRQALQKVGQLDIVQVLDGQGYPQRRFVTLGKFHDSTVEVISGLREGEAVGVP